MEDLGIRAAIEAASAELESPTADVESTPAPVAEDASPASTEDSEPTTASDATSDESTDASPATEDAPVAAKPTTPESDDELEGLLKSEGAIPYERVKKIIENARAKERAKFEAEVTALSWAKSYSPDMVEQALRVVQYAENDPVGFFRQIEQNLRQHPVYGQQLAPQPVPQKAEAPSEKPKPDVLLEDGRLVYSDAQLEKLLSWERQQVLGTVQQELKPFKEQQKQAYMTQRAQQLAQQIYADAKTWPGFDEHQKEMARVMREENITLDAAYRKVVVPKLKADEKSIEERVRQRVLAELKQKRVATTENPKAVTREPESYKGKSVREIIELTARELGM